jgi:hypothetical protein
VKAKREECIPGKDCHINAINFVVWRLASTWWVIVHAGKVIMNQRSWMNLSKPEDNGFNYHKEGDCKSAKLSCIHRWQTSTTLSLSSNNGSTPSDLRRVSLLLFINRVVPQYWNQQLKAIPYLLSDSAMQNKRKSKYFHLKRSTLDPSLNEKIPQKEQYPFHISNIQHLKT